MKKILNKVIIDLEFNGLPRYGFTPEINQIKIYNLTNNLFVCQNYKTKKKATIGSLLKTGEIKGDKLFNKKEFELLLKKVGATTEDNFIGFSIKTDKELLSLYNIYLSSYKDIQESLMLSKYEKTIAREGRSMETCYALVTGKIITPSHNGLEELNALVELYKKTEKLRHKKYLTVYPWGEQAGMPLVLYVEENRRRADGYRYNNEDVLATSLDYYIENNNWWDE